MEVEVSHFVDAGERDPKTGLYDYYYEGDTYTFRRDDEQLVVRTYVDDPAAGNFVGLTCAGVRASPLAVEAATHLRALGVQTLTCLGAKGTYEVWSPAL